ncbi:MAG: ester cyclase [Actinomycetota bacterium]|nr:ester cyclase [Actinomycetota bacterium]
MSEENKALIRRWVEEVVNAGNLTVADEIMAPDYAFYVASRPTPVDREGHRHLVATFLGAFPDLRRNIEEMVGEEEKVVERWTVRGTHQGEFQGLAPTGRSISYAGITIWRIGGGKIVENRTVQDFMGLMQQLGAERIPTQTPSQRL